MKFIFGVCNKWTSRTAKYKT